MPSDKLLTPAEVAELRRLKAEFFAAAEPNKPAYGVPFLRFSTATLDVSDALFLAAELVSELLPEMAKALEAAEIALTPDVGQYVPVEFHAVQAALARYRRAVRGEE